ncbi:MAG: hypothetical protein ACTSVV_14760 [Promethearchaeota archaeon]
MKELSHMSLTRLIIECGSIPFNKKESRELLYYSIEPDVKYKKKIKNNKIISKFFFCFIWLIMHTLLAKYLAIRYLKKSYELKMRGDPFWVHYLGNCFHYIGDLATPHHSFLSKVNPIIIFSLFGSFCGEYLNYILNLLINNIYNYPRMLLWAFVGGIITLIIISIYVKTKHDEFENSYDENWKKYGNLIKKKFVLQNNEMILTQSFDDILKFFKKQIHTLQDYCNSYFSNWFLESNGNNFINYMVEIALIMDLSSQIVVCSNIQ